MRVATQGPFAVGIVRWHWPQPGFTVVVKTTYPLDRDGRAEPRGVQLGLCVDDEGYGAADELEYATDFAPLKTHCDLLVVGHARATAPSSSLPIEVWVDDFRKAAQVHPPTPTDTAPLTARTMQCDGGIAGFAPRRSMVSGWRHVSSLQHFDFGLFNAAPEDQQLAQLRPDARLILSGLLEGAPRREVRLGGLEPEVCHLPGEASGDAPRRVQLRCDTLWIHTDRRLCTLTWRGLVESAPDPAARLVVTVRGPEPRPLERIASEPIDGECTAAVEPEAIRPGPPAERPLPLGAGFGSARSCAEPARPPNGGGTVAFAQMFPVEPTVDDDEVDDDEVDEEQLETHQIVWSPDQDTVDQPPAGIEASQLDDPLDEHTVDLGPLPDPGGLDGTPAHAPAPSHPGAPPGSPSAGGAPGTMMLTSPVAPQAALPFDLDAPLCPPEGAGDTDVIEDEPSAQSITGEVQIGGKQPVLPFQAGASQPPPPVAADRVDTGTAAFEAISMDGALAGPAAAAEPAATGTVEFSAVAAAAGPAAGTPFDAPAPSAAAAPAAPDAPATATPSAAAAPAAPDAPATPTPSAAAAPATAAASEPASPRPVVPTPSWHPPGIGAVLSSADTGAGTSGESAAATRDDSKLPLETYAAIKVRLWDAAVPAEEVLQQFGIDELTWRAAEVAQARAIARDAAAGRGQLAVEVRNAVAKARRSLEAKEPAQADLDLDQFAELLVAMQNASDEDSLLREREIEPAEWKRIQRHWEGRARAERQVAEQLRTKIAQARRALRK